MFAAASDADFGTRVEEAKETEHFQAALRGELVAMLQRCACRRDRKSVV